jgi:predicted phage terminase large subunit-like protein
MLAGYTVRTKPETGDKVVRAGPASAQWEAGNISLVKAPWNEPFVQTLEAFPDPAVHDDDVDALSGAVGHLSLKKATTFERWGNSLL